jgi:hypothetical protein
MFSYNWEKNINIGLISKFYIIISLLQMLLKKLTSKKNGL